MSLWGFAEVEHLRLGILLLWIQDKYLDLRVAVDAANLGNFSTHSWVLMVFFGVKVAQSETKYTT